MANTSSRTLRLLSLLQARRYWPGADLAAQLQVSPRTLRRDIDRLRELGYPIQAQRGVEGGYLLAPGTALPPLVVDDEEAVALAVGLQAATQGGVEGIAESSVRALAKVVQVMPARLRRRVEALGAMTVPRPGGAGPRRAWIRASSPASRWPAGTVSGCASPTPRRPASAPTGTWNRTAWSCSAAAGTWSATTSPGMTGAASGSTGSTTPRGTGIPFRPRTLPAADAAAFVRAGMDNVFATYDVEVIIEAPAADVAQRIGRWSTVEELGATRCRVRMSGDSLDWPSWRWA